MIKCEMYNKAKIQAATLMKNAGLVISEREIEEIDVADFGLSNLEKEGAQILSLFDTERVAGRVIALFPYQTEPEHWHVKVGDTEGKEETLRVIQGKLLVFIEGENNISLGKVPEENARYYTCRKEIVLLPSETITFQPGEKHWFQASDEACVFYTMSTTANDAKDLFTDPKVVRKTKIID